MTNKPFTNLRLAEEKMTWGGTEVPSSYFAAGENTNFRETRTTTGGRRMEHWPMYKCAPFGKTNSLNPIKFDADFNCFFEVKIERE
ncbi:hypothetical protein MKZ08_15345 [Viridibacillus sp. FSL R5-0477]|uniref:hypothetical protein n=1 Tax=Bacillales TaxID=1385 RepID=UPI00117F90F2|nr:MULTISPECIES: hypothetical protein [Bacillales]